MFILRSENLSEDYEDYEDYEAEDQDLHFSNEG